MPQRASTPKAAGQVGLNSNNRKEKRAVKSGTMKATSAGNAAAASLRRVHSFSKARSWARF